MSIFENSCDEHKQRYLEEVFSQKFMQAPVKAIALQDALILYFLLTNDIWLIVMTVRIFKVLATNTKH